MLRQVPTIRLAQVMMCKVCDQIIDDDQCRVTILPGDIPITFGELLAYLGNTRCCPCCKQPVDEPDEIFAQRAAKWIVRQRIKERYK